MNHCTDLPSECGTQALSLLARSLSDGIFQPIGPTYDLASGTLAWDRYGNLWFKSSFFPACVKVYLEAPSDSASNESQASATSPSTTKS